MGGSGGVAQLEQRRTTSPRPLLTRCHHRNPLPPDRIEAASSPLFSSRWTAPGRSGIGRGLFPGSCPLETTAQKRTQRGSCLPDHPGERGKRRSAMIFQAPTFHRPYIHFLQETSEKQNRQGQGRKRKKGACADRCEGVWSIRCGSG